jgi:AcrR family transcriptional regulator
MNQVKGEPQWPLRRAKAAVTRQSIVEAAGGLFVRDGYEATSIDAVAREAGVSRATVFNSVGGKAALLKAAYDIATVGDDEPIPLPQRAEATAVRLEPDPRVAASLYASMIANIGERLAPIYEVFRAAAGSDPEIRALWQSIQAERSKGARGFVGLLLDKGPLRAGLDADTAGDVVWVLIDASLYHRLVIERGWTKEQFRDWLAETFEAQLLPPRRSTSRSRRPLRDEGRS